MGNYGSYGNEFQSIEGNEKMHINIHSVFMGQSADLCVKSREWILNGIKNECQYCCFCYGDKCLFPFCFVKDF